jgi:acylphosphatase
MANSAEGSARLCRRIVYRGRVQGVGFRYTARGIAQRFDVSGYVKNLPDGTVEIVVDGSPDVVAAFLGEIADRFRENLSGVHSEDLAPSAEFRGFGIRH